MKKFIKKANAVIGVIIGKILPKYFVMNRFLAATYYLLFSGKFKREQYAVLKGKVKYLNEMKEKKSNIYTLIRNIHRIEKGLLMRPRRPVFALEFITETVDAFVSIWSPELMKSDPQYKWFFDVLQEYFHTSGENPIVDKQKIRFLEKVGSIELNGIISKSIPYSRVEENKPQISFEEFYKLTRYRRSVRWFLEKRVPHDLVDKAILAASQSPTACNRQPFEYRIVDEPELLNKVANLPMGVKGYVEGIPMMVVVIGNLDAYFDERDRHLIYIDASLANMAFMFALETLGLGSCPINWPDIEKLEIRMDKVLKLRNHQRTIMCIAVGYPDPDGKVAYSEKRPLKNIRKFN